MKSASTTWKADATRESSGHLSLFPDAMKEKINGGVEAKSMRAALIAYLLLCYVCYA